MKRIYIDGSAGTTGLEIRKRLSGRSDLEVLSLPEEKRKDVSARQEIMNQVDLVFLCLPDDAAMEAAGLVQNPSTVVIDASTAHRTEEGWVYGFPELSPGQKEAIRGHQRIANPGCHATGFIALVAPLVKAGLLKPDTRLSCFSLTGYTGGGKKMIAEYEAEGRSPLLAAPRQYGLTQQHKHLREMQKVTGLTAAPIFCPVVADFPRGMEVTVPLWAELLDGTREEIVKIYREAYPGSGTVHVSRSASEGGFLSAVGMAGRDDLEIMVEGSEDRILLIARFDNLGKGASGAAIQNMNLALGFDEFEGLNIP
ncbi:MAG: N-acetyl-gamma-glutamyl-phosphate reductase [Clostridia bacterium]|nr:N-acetyl-gamma-glutamyl-phosphate reductase [Clostridia bacterium]